MSEEAIKQESIILCENLVKIYKTMETEVQVLQGLDLVVQPGEIMAIIGSSGSGKSTLLNMLGGLDRPSAGRLIIDGKDMMKLSDAEMVNFKRHTVSFIWQNSARNLLPYLTALENVELPMQIAGKKNRELAKRMLEMVGLEKREGSKLFQLSGGEQQRVAIALALANRPKILLADEPTGAVDNATANRIMDIFRQINHELGITIIIVTHDLKLSAKVDRVVQIRDGRTSTEYIRRQSGVAEDAGFDKGGQAATHDEYVVLDKVGRLQIPSDMMDLAGLTGKSRVRLEFENGRIMIIPFEEG